MNTILTDDEREEIFQQCADADEQVVDRYGRAIEAAVLAKLREQEPVINYAVIDEYVRDKGVNYNEACCMVRAALAAPLPAVVQVPQGLIEAVDRVLEEAHCDCPHRLRFDDGEHLSGCPLFDLNVARLEMLAAAPEAPAQSDPMEKLTRIQEELGLYNDKPAQAIPAELDVRRILLDVVPGDGSGQEVYAKNVDDVVRVLTELSEKAEAQAIPAPWREAVKVAREALAWIKTGLGCNDIDAVIAQLDALEGGG